jgi:glycine/D-amino acid oxidase-like deaminating enzyme
MSVSEPKRTVLVVGGGIVGICLARELADAGCTVTVLERDEGEPRGSTRFAPGFVGVFNDEPLLTELARASARIYDEIGAGAQCTSVGSDSRRAVFARTGGLEIATSARGTREVARRADAARAAGLPAQLVAPSELPSRVAALIDLDRVESVGLFPADGSADVPALLACARQEALARGVRIAEGIEVVEISRDRGTARVTSSDGASCTADDVVLAGGIWGSALMQRIDGSDLDLPLVPVAHPYVYSGPSPHLAPGPFLRWPEHHVYARVHEDRLGIGTYDHAPQPVDQQQLDQGAALPWDPAFSDAIDSAQELLHERAQFAPQQRVDGVFAMSPDNLPFVGPHPEVEGVWIAQGLWVTHAAGAARMLAQAMTAQADLPARLAADRFSGDDASALRTSALRLYRDIYASAT